MTGVRISIDAAFVNGYDSAINTIVKKKQSSINKKRIDEKY